MIIDRFRPVWTFLFRLRRGRELGSHRIFLEHIAKNDPDPKVRAYTAHQLAAEDRRSA